MRISTHTALIVAVTLCMSVPWIFLYIAEKPSISPSIAWHASQAEAGSISLSKKHPIPSVDKQAVSPMSPSLPLELISNTTPSISSTVEGAGRARPTHVPPVLIAIDKGKTFQHPFPLPMQRGQFTKDKPWVEKDCTTEEGQPLSCTFSLDPEAMKTAEGIYYHMPSNMDMPKKPSPQQVLFCVAEESPSYYPTLNDADHMSKCDAEATLRTCSQVRQYFYERLQDKVTGRLDMHLPPVPFEVKQHALVYINGNCYPPSGRGKIMEGLLALGDVAKVPVHSYGACQNNRHLDEKNKEAGGAKTGVISKYKFCVAMENSISYEYVTEKIWEGLASGCIPVYLGTPNIRDLVPDPGSVIVYGPGGDVNSPLELDALMHKIGSDRALYESYVAWKTKPLASLGSFYRNSFLPEIQTTNECRMCRFIVQHRKNPQQKYTTCLFNETWMEARRKAGIGRKGFMRRRQRS